MPFHDPIRPRHHAWPVTNVPVPAPPPAAPAALAITLPYSASGAHADETIQWYRFELTASRVVTIDLTGSDYDTYLVLFDAAGAVVSFNDDFTDDDPNSLTSKIVTAPLGSGSYYIASLGYGPNSTGPGFAVDISGHATQGEFGTFVLNVTAAP